MNVLITGARAPISADLTRALTLAGHRVWLADSLRWPIGAASPSAAGYVRLPAPRENFPAFTAALITACLEFRITVIVPTSEEVFWLAAAAPKLPSSVKVRTSPFATLAQLHDKIAFAALATTLGYGAPEAIRISSTEQLSALAATSPERLVLKPAFSRFAAHVLLSPSSKQLRHLQPTAAQLWLAQTRIRGPEYCLYNIAHHGRLILHVAYEPALRFGRGAGLYFRPVQDERLRTLAECFIAATEFTGQISFDVIDGDSGLVALECNPRGTSGVHLAAQFPSALASALLDHIPAALPIPAPRALKLPVLLSQPLAFVRAETRPLLRAARDVHAVAGITIFAQLRALAELSWIAVRSRRGLAAASTFDCEWNGEPIDG